MGGGVSLAPGPGDVNEDGFADLIVGSPGADGNPYRNPRVRLKKSLRPDHAGARRRQGKGRAGCPTRP